MQKKKVRKIGEILHRSPIAPNILIAKLYDHVIPGTIVYDSRMSRIGTVIEIFGPVRSPYSRIKLDDISQPIHAHAKIFAITGNIEKVFWRKMVSKKRRRR